MKYKLDVSYIEKSARHKFQFIDFLNSLFIYFPILLILMGFAVIKSYYMNGMTGLNSLLLTGLIILLISLVSIIIIIVKLIQNQKFIIVSTGLTKSENIDIAQKVLKSLYNRPITSNLKNQLLYCNSKTSLFSWGEINIVLCRDNEILINSRPTGQPITLYESRLNIIRIRREILKELQQPNR